ncbi:PepSY domain-containing protein [Calditerrivibrio nitroreducens]|uniref:Propeptide PepSY amd peptidase M4 n=1 Tax=Calditerrivibrio nitroreducens (strain DSM 19672 / NBRC 101217 / Yu37-1) TaxID=768670 RepID=E4TIV2_CALNY|nr:PepSY domain-containing protein [Calditerrivibrio nitroreducens]ADR18057.1 Propeptide PepSY amd peptidase M4 [Calditerrivibrio nitroreducens DSM 19672]
MKNRKKLTALALGALLLATSAVGIAAASGQLSGSIKITQDNEVDYAKLASVNIDQAVASALKAQPGQVIKAGLENEDGFLVWGVEVALNNQIHEVKIDAKNAKVLKIETDQPDSQKEGSKEKD